MRLCAPVRMQQTRWLAAAAALVLCLVPGAREVTGQTSAAGSISGRVTLTTRMRGVPISTSAYAARSVNDQRPPASPEMRAVVVYLKDVKYADALAASTVEIRQEHESFSPRVVAITRGSTVNFPNVDPFFHNVFSLSGAASFDLGRYQAGTSRGRQFTRAGVVKVYCHLHSQMSATIVVFDHPYFATPESDGSFTLANVPPGTYTLVGWHERVGEQKTTITVTAGRPTRADISLPVEDTQ